MSEPTQEQPKEFWEGYGFCFESGNPSVSIPAVNPYWIYPDGSLHKDTPPVIDLNNLFKYAVPKALKAIEERGYCPPIMKLFQLWYDELVTQTGDSNNIEQAALALFWALWQVKEK